MLALHQQQRPVDIVTLADALDQADSFDRAGGPAAIIGLINETPTALHAEHYAAIVLEHRLKRDLVAAAETIARLAYDPGCTSSAALSRAYAAVETVAARQPASGLVHVRQPTAEVLDQVEAAAQAGVLSSGIPTGFAQLDRLLAGLQRQNLIYLGARPGMGKTSLALSIAQHVARQGEPVAVFSLEMSKEQPLHQLLATNARIDTQRIRLGQFHETEWAALLDAANYMDDTPSATLFNLRASCQRLMAETGRLALVVVDYIQLMSAVGRQENWQQEISVISCGLKALAREIDAPLLVISQISCALETRAEKQPVLSDLKESGSLEQDADVVLFI
jgi:replicative DNA helicase